MTNDSEVVSVPLAPRDWNDVPRLILRAKFLEFMHNTGWPERFDGVVDYIEPFNIDADFEVIC
uniref:hypothetical protein n=1 Tax=Maricaulis sp. TaxID=1486257 RepID=UPI003A948E30